MKQLVPARLIVVSCAAFLLASCGGGGGGADDSPAAESPNTATLANTTVASTGITIDAAIPEATQSKIQQVISPFGAAIPGAPVAIPAATGNGDTIVMAVDAEENILLAALTSSGNTTLTVASTCNALARIAFGSLPAPLTPAAFQKAVQETPAYPQLVAAVQDAVDTGVPAAASEAVQTAITTVLEQATPALSAAMGTATASPMKTAATVKTDKTVTIASNHDGEVKAPFPFNTIPDATGGYSVYVRGGAVDLVNTMQIHWAAFSDVAPSKEVALPPISIGKAVTGYAAPWLQPDPVNLQGNQGKGFFLTIQQTPGSRLFNVQSFVLQSTSMLLDFTAAGSAVSDQCRQSVAKALVSQEELNTFSRNPSAETFRTYFTSVAGNTAKSIDVIDQCLTNPDARRAAAEHGSRVAKAILKMLSGIQAVDSFLDGTTLANMIPQMVKYWNQTYKLKVCEAADSGTVVSCVAKMTFEPANIAMIEGAVFEPVIKGFAVDGAPTLLPSGLVYEALSDSVAFFKPESADLFALKLGQGPVRVTDPFTETVSDPYSVEVVIPTFNPGTFSVGVGGSVTGGLKGPAGKSLVTSNKGGPTINNRSLLADVKTANPAIASLRASGLNLLTDNAFTVTGVALGSTTLSVTNTYTGKAVSAGVEVRGEVAPTPNGPVRLPQVSARLVTENNGAAGLRVLLDLSMGVCGPSCPSLFGAYINYSCNQLINFADGSTSGGPFSPFASFNRTVLINPGVTTLQGPLLSPSMYPNATSSITCSGGSGEARIDLGPSTIAISSSGGTISVTSP